MDNSGAVDNRWSVILICYGYPHKNDGPTQKLGGAVLGSAPGGCEPNRSAAAGGGMPLSLSSDSMPDVRRVRRGGERYLRGENPDFYKILRSAVTECPLSDGSTMPWGTKYVGCPG